VFNADLEEITGPRHEKAPSSGKESSLIKKKERTSTERGAGGFLWERKGPSALQFRLNEDKGEGGESES